MIGLLQRDDSRDRLILGRAEWISKRSNRGHVFPTEVLTCRGLIEEYDVGDRQQHEQKDVHRIVSKSFSRQRGSIRVRQFPPAVDQIATSSKDVTDMVVNVRQQLLETLREIDRPGTFCTHAVLPLISRFAC